MDVHLASNKSIRIGGTDDAPRYTEKTLFMKVTLWNRQADYNSDKVSLGDYVISMGELVDDSYESTDSSEPGRGLLKLEIPSTSAGFFHVEARPSSEQTSS